MLDGRSFRTRPGRDLQIDWLRGLAMTCVIVNHSRISSLLSWFSYERFWVVTAAEVFVVLSGIVLGMVYGRRLVRDGWLAVARGLGRRAVMLYVTFVAVTISVLAISLAGIDISSMTTWDDRAAVWFLDPRNMDAAAWRDVALMRHGPWTFEIVGLYVWLVVAAVPCLWALRFAGWRPLLISSWLLYLSYHLAPHRLTSAEFESVFPMLTWQLLFVHGIAIGYHREQISARVARWPKAIPMMAAAATAAFALFALCNPRTGGPLWLRCSFVSPEHFTSLYSRYFGLSDLGLGRLANLVVGLPVGYAVLTWCRRAARPFDIIFVTLGQRSLGAFVLHVYGILLLSNLPHRDEVWTNTLAQVILIVAIAALLNTFQRERVVRHIPAVAPARRLAA
jgi:hypothetical protein